MHSKLCNCGCRPEPRCNHQTGKSCIQSYAIVGVGLIRDATVKTGKPMHSKPCIRGCQPDPRCNRQDRETYAFKAICICGCQPDPRCNRQDRETYAFKAMQLWVSA
eukprot:scaffold6764_cov46-Cylindrotheca_fusiformis.AAC.1